jgi:hypothetical protein
VHGKIFVNGIRPRDNCLVEVVHADTQKVAEELTVPPEFEKTVVVGPGSHDFYFLLSCPGARAFKSETFEVRAAEQYKKPIELGTISLQSESR